MPYIAIEKDFEHCSTGEVLHEIATLKSAQAFANNGDGLTSFPKLDETMLGSGQYAGEVSTNHTGLGGGLRTEQQSGSGDGTRGVENPQSQPPSPPDSGSSTPRLSIMPCPVRLTAYLPPPNYGTVETGTIFRSGFPHDRNLEFVKSLRVQAVLTLVETAPTSEYTHWISEFGIQRHCVAIAPNKDGYVHTTLSSLCEAVLFALNPAHYPLYIHCNQGRHRTGCVVACLRKIQQWPLRDILDEYEAYAHPKARPGDLELIRSFDPQCLLAHAAMVKRTSSSTSTAAFLLKRLRTEPHLDVFALAKESALSPHHLSSAGVAVAADDGVDELDAGFAELGYLRADGATKPASLKHPSDRQRTNGTSIHVSVESNVTIEEIDDEMETMANEAREPLELGP